LRPRTYHVPRRFTPSADSLISFQSGALSGRRPSELNLAEIALPLGTTSPLAIGEPTTVGQTLGLLSLAPPQDWPATRAGSSNSPVKDYPSWIASAWRFRRYRHCCRSGLASGVLSLHRLGRTVAGFLRVQRPWLSWASSSLGHSPSRTWAYATVALALTSNPTAPHASRLPFGSARMRSASSRHFGAIPVPGSGPCASEYQRAGKLACLFRGFRPLEVSVLVPVAR